MFIEDIEHAAKHFAAGVLRYLLRDRNKLHADLAKLADIKFRMERVAAEPAQRMNQDEVERMIGFPGGEDHFLKNGAILVKRSEEHTSELQSLMRTSYAVFCLKK